jgi:Ca2+-binding RTX toxin-like protein
MSREALEAAKFAKMLAQNGLSTREVGTLDDVFVATSRIETFNGSSSARDTVSYHNSTAGVRVDLYDLGSPGSAREVGGFANNDTLRFIDNVIGSNFADTIQGDLGANVLVGLGGNDSLNGIAGADKLYGGAGNDTLSASARDGVSVVMDGGADVDTLNFRTTGGDATITTGTGRDVTNIFISDSSDFRIVMTDFQPYWETFGNTVTDAEAARGDRLNLRFDSGLGTDINAVAAFEQIIQGDDLIFRFDNATVHGEIVLQDIGQYLDLTDLGYAFAIDASFFSQPQPV